MGGVASNAASSVGSGVTYVQSGGQSTDPASITEIAQALPADIGPGEGIGGIANAATYIQTGEMPTEGPENLGDAITIIGESSGGPIGDVYDAAAYLHEESQPDTPPPPPPPPPSPSPSPSPSPPPPPSDPESASTSIKSPSDSKKEDDIFLYIIGGFLAVMFLLFCMFIIFMLWKKKLKKKKFKNKMKMYVNYH